MKIFNFFIFAGSITNSCRPSCSGGAGRKRRDVTRAKRQLYKPPGQVHSMLQ